MSTHPRAHFARSGTFRHMTTDRSTITTFALIVIISIFEIVVLFSGQPAA
jgi:hypothetical protein